MLFRSSRLMYSTDASIYEIEPIGVVIPRTHEDVFATMEIAREESVEEVSQDLRDLEGLTPQLIAKLAEANVHTRDDLADLAVDELVELTGMDDEAAKTLIMKAREHWFAAEAAAQENAARATADAETPQETTTQG